MEDNGFGGLSCCLLFLLIFPVWGAISPRSMWEITQAWRYKNPDANEPSDAAFKVMRVGNTFVAILLAAFACAGIGAGIGESYDEQRYEECLDSRGDTWDSQDFDACEHLKPEF